MSVITDAVDDGADFFTDSASDDSTTNNPVYDGPLATIVDRVIVPPASEFRILKWSQITRSPLNPRKHFDEAGITALAESIKAVGMTTPIMVRQLPDDGFGDLFEIIMGERRYRAAVEADLLEIPAIIRKNVSDADLLGLAITENIKRSDLSVLEEAAAYQQALTLEPGLTQRDLAKRFGIAQPTVANALRLLQLPEAVRLQIERGELSRSHGVSLASLTDQPETCVRFGLQAAKESWPVATLEYKVREYKEDQESRRQPKLMETEVETSAKTPAEIRRDLLDRLMSMGPNVSVDPAEIDGQDKYVQTQWEIYQAGLRGDTPEWGKPCRFFIEVGPDKLVHRVDYDAQKAAVAQHFTFRGPAEGVSETGYRSVYFTLSDTFPTPREQARHEAEAIYAETAWGKKRIKEAAKESPAASVSAGPEQKPDGQLSTWFQWCSRAGLPGTAANWEAMRGDAEAPAWIAYSQGLKPSEYAAQRGHLPSEPLPDAPVEVPEIVTTPAPVANPEPTLEVPAGAPSAVFSAPSPARQVEATKPTTETPTSEYEKSWIETSGMEILPGGITGVISALETTVSYWDACTRAVNKNRVEVALATLRSLETPLAVSTAEAPPVSLTADGFRVLQAINEKWNAEHDEDMQTTLEERLELTVFSRAQAMGIDFDQFEGDENA